MNTAKNVRTESMNDKLIRRAAQKYRNWMVTKSQEPPSYDVQYVIKDNLSNIINKSYDIRKWVQRFLNGNKRRIQFDPYEPAAKHIGIVSSDVYKYIATDMIPDVGQATISHIKTTMVMLETIIDKSVITPLSSRQAIEEIKIINQTWDKVKFRDNILSILIKNVTLEDEEEEVYLGSFCIQLDLTNPIKGLRIESVDEIRAEGSGDYYHPHVEKGELCAGDGGLPMKEAICQGRLEDYFRIVEAILRTYNGDSPHKSLSDWYEPSHEGEFYCENCDEWRDDEEYSSCDKCGNITCSQCNNAVDCCVGCGNYYCTDCSIFCVECGEVVCMDCGISCYNCEDVYCSSCVTSCKSCDSYFCSSCLEKCATCNDPICESCLSKCDCCEKENGSDCIKECEDCNYDICNNCLITCEHCGVSACSSCSKKHNCLLKETEK